MYGLYTIRIKFIKDMLTLIIISLVKSINMVKAKIDPWAFSKWSNAFAMQL